MSQLNASIPARPADPSTVHPTASTQEPLHLTINLIGPLRIQRGGTLLDARKLGGPKPRQILEILLLQLGNPVSKDRLIDLLWCGNAPAEALPTLESYVSVLRRNLQPGAGRSGPLRTSTGGYFIDRSMVDVDLDRFETLLRSTQQAEPVRSYGLLHEALDLATAPLLGDELLPTWAEEERALHETRVTEATILAAETASALGLPEEAISRSNRALDRDPLNERAWTALILAFEQAGRYAEGLRQYERCRRAMDRELGCAPGSALKAAYVRLLQATAEGEGDLSDVLSALLTLHSQLSQAAETSGRRQSPAGPVMRKSLNEAGNILNAFLRRALAAA